MVVVLVCVCVCVCVHVCACAMCTQCEPLLVEEAILQPVHNLWEDREAVQAYPNTRTQLLPSCHAHDMYNTQQCVGSVLPILFKHLKQHLPPGAKVIADLPGRHTPSPLNCQWT